MNMLTKIRQQQKIQKVSNKLLTTVERLCKMKTYRIEIVIQEGNDEFWEQVTADGKSGVDEVLDVVKTSLEGCGLDIDFIKVKEFKDEPVPDRYK